MPRTRVKWVGDRPPTAREARAIASGVRSGAIRSGDRVGPFSAKRAARKYREFHWGRNPKRASRVTLPDLSELYELGRLRAVEYDTTKGRERATWVHHFSKPFPILTATPDGRLGPIVGGRAHVTERGIEK